MTPEIEAAALAIHAQRRNTFAYGPAPHTLLVTITGPGGTTWDVRFSGHMSAKGTADIIAGIAKVAEKPNANPELIAFTLAYIQAESDSMALEHGDAA